MSSNFFQRNHRLQRFVLSVEEGLEWNHCLVSNPPMKRAMCIKEREREREREKENMESLPHTPRGFCCLLGVLLPEAVSTLARSRVRNSCPVLLLLKTEVKISVGPFSHFERQVLMRNPLSTTSADLFEYFGVLVASWAL
jgi:hypothetical protein